MARLMSRSEMFWDPTWTNVSLLPPNPPPEITLLDITHRESDEDQDEDNHHDGSADGRFRQSAERSKHVGPARGRCGSSRFRCRFLDHQAPLSTILSGGYGQRFALLG